MLFPHRLPTGNKRALGLDMFKILDDTKLSYKTTSADSNISLALIVSSLGSPGPAPTKYTVDFISEDCFNWQKNKF